jgi:thioredoxin reductase
MKSDEVLEVAIIGAGPSGLVAAKSLLEQGITNIAVFEETSAMGGLWNRQGGELNNGKGSSSSSCRSPVPCLITHPIDSDIVVCEVPCSPQPVYQALRANFPKDMTSFLGHCFDPTIEFFPDAPTVAAYYQSYSERFQVDAVTHLNTRVVQCTKQEHTQQQHQVWKVETMDTTKNHENQKETFYSRRLLVCNGHFRKAYCPYVLGMEHFVAKKTDTASPSWLHSSAFDSAATFQGKSVLIVGGGISGSDIARILVETGNCARIVVSARKWKAMQSILLPRLQKKGLAVRPGIRRIDEQGRVHFLPIPLAQRGKNGYYTDHDDDGLSPATESPDVILFATGYRYYFPFLKNTATTHFMREDGFKMERLYKRILSVDDPSLAFLGITNQNLSPALVMEYQARWFATLLAESSSSRSTTNNRPSILSLPPMDGTKNETTEHERHLWEMMIQEVESRDANDTTQEALLLQFPSYCNSLAEDIGIRGYWTQILLDRVPLMIRSVICSGVGWTIKQSSTAKQMSTAGRTIKQSSTAKQMPILWPGYWQNGTANYVLLGTASALSIPLVVMAVRRTSR